MKYMRVAIAGLTLTASAFIGLVVKEDYIDRARRPTPLDVPTYGLGTTTRPDGSPVQLGDTTNPVKAIVDAHRDILKFEGAIKRCVKVPLNQKEYDLYVDLAYNIGESGFCSSTIVERLNAGEYRNACDAILMWKRHGKQDCSVPGNKICWGLWLRRQETHAKCVEAQS